MGLLVEGGGRAQVQDVDPFLPYVVDDGNRVNLVFFLSPRSRAPIVIELKEPHALTAREIQSMPASFDVEEPWQKLAERTRDLVNSL